MATLRAVVAASFICCTSTTRQLSFEFIRAALPIFRSNHVLPTLYHNRKWNRDIQGTELVLGPRPHRRREVCTRASTWKSERSPYETLELDKDAGEEEIKSAYRRLAKHYHPDVYDGTGDLEGGETAEARFIKIQAAYELLMDKDQRKQYDKDNHANPMKASQAWMEWLMKKRKAFERRGDLAVTAWAEQQQLELNLRVRRLSRSKNDPDEVRKILAREKRVSMENFSNTMKRHSLVLKKRDLMRKKAEEDRKKTFQQLLASEGLELDSNEDDTT